MSSYPSSSPPIPFIQPQNIPLPPSTPSSQYPSSPPQPPSTPPQVYRSQAPRSPLSYDPQALSTPPRTPRTPVAKRTLTTYTPFTPVGREREEEGIQLTGIQRSPFLDSAAWESPSQSRTHLPSRSQQRAQRDSWDAIDQLQLVPDRSSGKQEFLDDEDEMGAFGEVDPNYPKGREGLLHALGYTTDLRYTDPRVSWAPAPLGTLFPPDKPPPLTLPPAPAKPTWTPPKSNIRILFTLTTRSVFITHLFPTFLISCVAACIPPYMTILIGDAFTSFSLFPLNPLAATADERTLLTSSISGIALKLTLLGLVGLALNVVVVASWVVYGEGVARATRGRVFESVMARGMEWFDGGMGMKGGGEKMEEGEKEENVGAGGLMGKFARETDDVRIATSQFMGLAIQHLLTFILCLLLGLIKSPTLTLVTLSAIPLVVLAQILTSIFANPLYVSERRGFAEASTCVERASGMIGTVKAFNAQAKEADRFDKSVDKAHRSLMKQALVWGISGACSNLFLLAMFIAGFWYGAKLVREGKLSSGEVTTVFWSSLLASAYLQMVIPSMVKIQQGVTAMASLMTIVLEPAQGKSSRPMSGGSDAFSPTTATMDGKGWNGRSGKTKIKRIRPVKARGEFTFANVTFSYPSRPDQLVLNNVSLFLPAGETTFIVGGSGSGKSTIAQLLLRLYEPDLGEITLDDQDISFLDLSFTREHMAVVQQSCILFDVSVSENVAMGLAGSKDRKPEDAGEKEIKEACRMALLDEFVEGLPEGYQTRLGNKGASLSGGQKQRLSIARARLRDPTILILDEATSALDATSRIVVFENIKKWRKNKTTIVITHDLSQIQPEDFVYLMKDGSVVEQGFRHDLIIQEGSEFGVMASMQAVKPLPEKEQEEWIDGQDVEEMLEGEFDGPDYSARKSRLAQGDSMRPQSRGFVAYLDILADYAKRDSFILPDPNNTPGSRMSMTPGRRTPSYRPPIRRLSSSPLSGRLSVSPLPGRITVSPMSDRRSRISLSPNNSPMKRLSMSLAPKRDSRPDHRLSALAVPRILRYDRKGSNASDTTPPSSFKFNVSQTQLDRPADVFDRPVSWVPAFVEDRPGKVESHDESSPDTPSDVQVEILDENGQPRAPVQKVFQSASRLMWYYFPSMPSKYLLFGGALASVGRGVCTPIWAKYIAQLMAHVSAGGVDQRGLLITSLTVLAINLADAISILFQYYLLEAVANRWATKLRKEAFSLVLKQEQGWFDKRENASSRLVQTLIKDADDMRPLMSHVIGKSITVAVMIALGLAWAIGVGWRIALVGLAVAPVFAAFMLLESKVLSKLEGKNKAAREELTRTFYESAANIRSIRAMALEEVFQTKFDTEQITAYKTGKISAYAQGLGHGVTEGIPFFAQALLIFVSAQFMAQGLYSWPTVIQVYTLVMFSVTFGTQMMDFLPSISKAKMAASDFNRLATLTTTTEELSGDLRFPISGNIQFSDVHFSYPTRVDAPILSGVSFELQPGECVAIVGPSGSGKSTIASLIQRLYEPTSGSIKLGTHDLNQADVRWLRDHIAVVSQSANLFDGTVSDNIAYGAGQVPIAEIQRAAKSANVHDFIMTLPDGYDTNLGENASLISGGQAQRFQIARALLRRSSILILDECTSALDVANQQAVLDTIMRIKQGKTTVFITHKADVMKRCDRLLCLSEGEIVEEGSYEELIARGGMFASLMSAGEWE